MKNISKLFILFLIAGISGCSGYEKILKSPDTNLKYRKALEYYNSEDYARATGLFEQLVPLTRGSSRADTVNFFLAKSYYGQKDYILAGHYFKDFTKNFPKNKFAEESEFMVAYTSYLLSPRPSLDQTNTYNAIQAFKLFVIKYPQSKRVEEARKLITDLENKLVEKSYLSAKLYYDLSDYKASIIALTNSLNDYPDTKYREELMFLILKSNFLLAENSVSAKKRERFQQAVDEYYAFIGEFPESKYAKEAEKIYNTSMDNIN